MTECVLNISFLVQQRVVRYLPNSVAQVILVKDETQIHSADVSIIVVICEVVDV